MPREKWHSSNIYILPDALSIVDALKKMDHNDLTSVIMPGNFSLMELLDKRILIVMRDGKRLLGNLRSYDQYGNMVLSETLERLYKYPYYSEEYLGLFLIRGENVLLFGEFDADKDREFLTKESLLDYTPRLDSLTIEDRSSIGGTKSSLHVHQPAVHAPMSVEGWKREPEADVIRGMIKDKFQEIKSLEKLKRQMKKEYGLLEAEIIADFE